MPVLYAQKEYQSVLSVRPSICQDLTVALSICVQDFTVDLYFRQYWTDSRLAFQDSEEDEICIGNEMLEKIWWPDTFFANAKKEEMHLVTTKNAFLRINNTGGVTQSLR